MANTQSNPIQRGLALIAEGQALLSGVFNLGQMTGSTQASVGTVRTRRRTSARRRTQAATHQGPQAVVGTQQGQQQAERPKRHLSRAARKKLSEAAKARWANKQPKAA